MERRGRPSYRHRRWDETAGIKEEIREEELRFTAGHRWWKKRLELDDDSWVPHGSEGEKVAGYRFGIGFLGRGLVQEVGRNGAPGSVLYFISFSSFPFSDFLFLS
jgi:hypothetical protein